LKVFSNSTRARQNAMLVLKTAAHFARYVRGIFDCR
jgi:hypothetical protein